MCDALVWSFDAITGLPWLEITKAIAPVATTVIAFLALKNWKRQDRAKRQAEFLDELIEATHSYIAEMSKPVTLARFVNIGIPNRIAREDTCVLFPHWILFEDLVKRELSGVVRHL
jgi:hypothetical protein